MYTRAVDRQVRLRAGITEQMLAHARGAGEIECCGLLAGSCGVITNIFPARNTLDSPAAYQIAPQDLFALFRTMREQGLEHLGIYHSHPSGENAPSPRDIEEAYYPRAVYFILDPRAEALRPTRAFSIRDGSVTELEIVTML